MSFSRSQRAFKGKYKGGSRMRGSVYTSSARRARARRNLMVARFRPGYDRTGGYYGRFAGANAEMKFKDTVINDALATGVRLVQLTVVPEGNGESERIGRKFTIKKIHVKGCLTLPAFTASTSTSDCVTLMLVQDTQTNGAAFVATDLLDLDTFHSFRNLANSTRFNVLWKKIYTMKSPSAGAGYDSGDSFTINYGEDVRWFSANVNCNISMEYDNSATTGAIGTVRSNNVYWVTQSSSGLCDTIGTCRLRYSDK